jgi:excisionase family DNA binding protein
VSAHGSLARPAPNRLWTIRDVADFARVSTRTVHRRIADGTLPAIRIGGLVRFDPHAVTEALEGSALDGQSG